MKIAIDGRGINWYKGTGIGTYTDMLLSYLLKIDNNDSFYIFWSGNNYKFFKKDNTTFLLGSRRNGSFYEDFYIPKYLERENVDLYHIPQNGLGIPKNFNGQIIITIHDLIPYIMPSTVGCSYLKKFIKNVPDSINRANKIITVSNFSKLDILKYFPIDENSISVIPLSANTTFSPIDKEKCSYYLKEKYNILNPYIFYIGGFSPRKNVSALIKTFSEIYKFLPIKYSLVIGGCGKDSLEELKIQVKTLNLEKYIIFPGFIEDEILPIFYNGSSLFVYPSLYEGFGLPPLEAMSCKIPVLASNVSSIPEVVGDSGVLFNPLNENELGEEITRLLNQDNLLKYYGEKGYERSKLFSWENTAIKTLEVYKSIEK